MYRRSLSLALGLLAGLGVMSQPPVHVVASPWPQGVTRRTTRRADTRSGAWLPGKKGQAQKHHGKPCHHRKAARARRRSARVKGR